MFLNWVVGLYWFTGAIYGDVCKPGNVYTQYDPTDGEHHLIDQHECGVGVAKARTMVFVALCGTEILRAYTLRNRSSHMFKDFFRNPALLVGSTIAIGLVLIFVFTGANDVFGLTGELEGFGWALCLSSIAACTILDEIVKFLIIRFGPKEKHV